MHFSLSFFGNEIERNTKQLMLHLEKKMFLESTEWEQGGSFGRVRWGFFFSQKIDCVFCRQAFYCDRMWRDYYVKHTFTLPFTFRTSLNLPLPWINSVATNTSCQCDSVVIPASPELKRMLGLSWSHDSIKLTWLKYDGKISIQRSLLHCVVYPEYYLFTSALVWDSETCNLKVLGRVDYI